MKVTKMVVTSINTLSLVAIFFCSNVSGYQFTEDFRKGFYWHSFPVSMQPFVSDTSDGPLLEQTVNSVVNEWESSIGREIWNISPLAQGNPNSGNYIKWSFDFGNETGFDPSRTLAVTIRYNRGTFMERVVIILNGGMATLRQNFAGTLRKTLLHEFGHTVGLDHSTAYSIMQASLGSIDSVQADDVAGMSALISETMQRQNSGFVSPFSTNTETSESGKAIACGSVDLVDREGGGSAGGNLVGSLIVGVMLVILTRMILYSKRKILPTHFIS